DAGPAGDLAVRFEARSGRGSAAVDKRIHVEPRGRTVRTESTYAVSGTRAIDLALPEPVMAGGAVTLTLAAHPFVGFDTSLEALLASPDAGTEPVASSVLGLAAYAVIDTGRRPGSVPAAELRARAEAAIKRLTDLQIPTGGFG